MICRIKGETGWPFAGTDLVTLDDRLFLRIDDYQFASVFKILVDQPGFGVCLGVFRLSTSRPTGDDDRGRRWRVFEDAGS